jgi:hypothetical protein
MSIHVSLNDMCIVVLAVYLNHYDDDDDDNNNNKTDVFENKHAVT